MDFIPQTKIVLLIKLKVKPHKINKKYIILNWQYELKLFEESNAIMVVKHS